MRRFVYPFAMILATVLASCTIEPVENPTDDTPVAGKGQFIAVGGSFASKTAIDGASIIWSDNDAIMVYNGTESEEYTISGGQGTATATFTGADIADGSFYAVYPSSSAISYTGGTLTATIPATQYGVINSFDDNINLAVAKSDTRTLPFKNVCGYMRFQIIESDITEIVIKSNGGEAFAGDVDITFDGEGIPAVNLAAVANPSSTITLTPKAPATHFAPGVYIAAVLPREYASGIEISFTRLHEQEDALKVWPLTAKKTGSSSLTIARSVVKSLGIVDKQLAWECLGLNDTGVPLGYHQKYSEYGQFIDYQSGRTFCAIGAYNYDSILDACSAYKDGYGILAPVSTEAGSLYGSSNLNSICAGTDLVKTTADEVKNWSTRKTTRFVALTTSEITDASYATINNYTDLSSIFSSACSRLSITEASAPTTIWSTKITTARDVTPADAGYYAFKMSEGGFIYYGVFNVTFVQGSSSTKDPIIKFTYKIAGENTGVAEDIPSNP